MLTATPKAATLDGMKRDLVLCVGLTPAWQEIMAFERVRTGMVNRAAAMACCAAGKGPNVARALRALAGKPVLLGFAGGHTGRQFAADLRRAGVAARLIPDPAPTRLCVTMLDRTAGTVTELVGEATLPPPRAWRAFFAAYGRLLPRARLVVIAGAPMPGAAPGLYARLAREARRAGVAVLLDTRNAPLMEALPHRPLIAKLNREELAATLGRASLSDKAVIGGARRLIDAGADSVVVTAGRRGAWLVMARAARRFVPPAIEVVNSVGCGDAMTAGIAAALAGDQSIEEAVRFGVACGAASALTLLPADLRPTDVRRILRKVKAAPVTPSTASDPLLRGSVSRTCP